MMSRETPLIPISDAREAALFFVVGALCFLAALAALTLRGTYTAAAAWGAQVEGEITVLLEDTDRRAGQAATAAISQIDGVASAVLLSEDALEDLLEPSFGPGGVPDGLPLPLLIAIDTETGAEPPVDEINQVLDQRGLTYETSLHSGYAEDVQDALSVLRLVALGAVGLLAATAIAVIAFATHAALLARRDIVDVLHLSGAEDRYVAGLFERRFWVLALKAGAGGAITALGVAALIVFVGSSPSEAASLLPQLTLDYWDLLILVVTPIAAGLAARIAARLTVMQSLKDTM